MSPIANYNPHAPWILGNEFVGIRDEALVYDASANSFERGYGLTLGTTRTVNNVRAYVNTFPPQFIRDRVFTASIYPRGYEDQSGPVRSVIIPCNAGTITGDVGGWSFLGGATDIPSALWNPSGINALQWRVGGGYTVGAALFFAVNQYSDLLAGKRILGVDLLMAVDIAFRADTLVELATYVANDYIAITGNNFYAPRYTDLITPTTPITDVRLDRIKLGDANRYFGVGAFDNPLPFTDISQWTYTQLQRFESAAANRLFIRLSSGPGGVDNRTDALLSYAALQVFYCEESRSAFGSRIFQPWEDPPANPITLGAMPIRMLTPAGVTNPTLAAGDYTVTFNESNLGDDYNVLRTSGREPIFNQLRELYTVPTVPGIQVNLPFPLNQDAFGTTLTAESTVLLPQLSLHASGGTLYESHVYGRQSAGESWNGTYFVRQSVDVSQVVGTAAYPWIRFWARRFGDTTGVLTVNASTSQATITVAEFDALEEVLDGWKEVSLRFNTPVNTTSASTLSVLFQPFPNQVSAGNRWEILGVSAPAISGSIGNQMNLVPSPNTLSLATYGQPVSGAAIVETWRPWQGPYVTPPTADPTSDVSFLLAQDLPAVSGFGALVTSQALTGIGQDCGLNPAYIPSALQFVRLTWGASSASVPVSGFGYYEIQRSDSLTDWQTIAKMTSPAASGFNDYEARIGMESSYRIRAVDYFLFYNAWSSTITATIPAPGVTATSITADDHVLVFTSNASQTGAYNLAYCMAWDGSVTEDFTFPEANMVQLQPMYDRNFFTAFHPLERGGDQFRRNILVQAAAIPPETLADFTSLRNMAWASLPYVCVRDEDGNRWLANVVVPSGRAQLNRTIYRAEIGITEVTETAAEVTV